VRAGALALLLPLALACRSPSDAGTVLRVWAMGREGEVVAQMMPAFERLHPGVRVRVQQVPWSAAHEKLLTAYVGGALPDVFQAGNTWLPELVALDALEPLDARLAASPDVAAGDFFPGVLDPNVLDGRTWALPWYVDTRLLFYRTDLVPGPPPRTWDAWRAAMARVAVDGRHAILLPLREWQVPVVLALQRGGDLLRDGDRYGNFETPAFREAFAFYLDLFRLGFAPKGGDTEVANLYQDFARGAFAYLVTGPWNVGELRARLPATLAGRWTTAPLPAPTADAYPGVSLAGGASLAVARGSSQKDLAWRLVEYLSTTAQQIEFHRLTGDLPARRAAWDDATLAADPEIRAFRVQLGAVRATPKIPEWEQIAARIAQYAEAAVRGDAAPDAALGALDADVDGLLEKRRWLLARASGR